MTQAEAINEMLESIGQEPISNTTVVRLLLDTVSGLVVGSQLDGDTSSAIGFVETISGNFVYVDVASGTFSDGETLNTGTYTINGLTPDEIEFDPYVSDVQEVKIALQRLKLSRRSILSNGWKFNTSENWEFPIDGDGFINIPSNALHVIPNTTTIIVKDGKLFDDQDNSNVFTESQDAKVIWDIEIDNMPEVIAQYILAHAVSRFQMKMVGDREQNIQNKRDEAEAKIAAKKYDIKDRKLNHFTSPFGLENEIL